MIVRSGNKKYLPIDAKPLIDYAEKHGMQVDPNGFRVNQLIDRFGFGESYYSTTMNVYSIRNEDGSFSIKSDNLLRKGDWLFGDYLHPFKAKLNDKVLILGNEYNLGYYLYRNGSANGQYIFYDGIYTMDSDKNNFGFYLGGQSVFKIGEPIDVVFVPKMVNLTEIFGAGNEPTLQWIEANRPDLLQNTDYIPNTITIEPKAMEVK